MAITLLILGLALGTFLIRVLPLTVLSRVELPVGVREWLRLVPSAVLAASLAQALLVQDGVLNLTWANSSLWAAIPAFLIAWRTRNMLATMLTGMIAYALLAQLLV
ncbi:MAG: AzlD domain-containing protein [Anaerolineae bacterium]|nr:AzlD domain-containing protein [Anaerolineae bacterium]